MQSKRRFRKGRGNGRSKSLRDQNEIQRIYARSLGTVTMSQSGATTGVAEFNLTVSNLGDRIVSIADTFAYWRLSKLRVKGNLQPGVYVAGGSTGANQWSITNRGEAYLYGLGFSPLSNADTTIPTGFSQLVDFPEWDMNPGNKPVSISVGAQGTKGSLMTKWLSTSTGPDAALQSAGTLTVGYITSNIADATSAGSIRLFLEFCVEFRSPLDTAVTPTVLIPTRQRVQSVSPSQKVVFDPMEEDYVELKEEKAPPSIHSDIVPYGVGSVSLRQKPRVLTHGR